VAALSTIEMTCVAVSTPVYMPHLVSLNAARFGFIGVAFALLSWLVVVSVVLVASRGDRPPDRRRAERPGWMSRRRLAIAGLGCNPCS
jgi:hypothetical protein